MGYGFTDIVHYKKFKLYLTSEQVRAVGDNFHWEQLNERLPINSPSRQALPGEWTGIYFIKAVSCNLIKIGRAKNVARRFAALEQGCPDQLLLMWCYAAPSSHELELHSKFRDIRSHGEWFAAEAPLTEYISRKVPGLFRPSRSRKAAA